MSKEKYLEFTFPIPRTLCGIFMGNGNLGAMVWGKDTLNITVNRADFWDHRGGELVEEGTEYEKLVKASSKGQKELDEAFVRKEYPEDVFRPQRIPLGRFEFEFRDGVRPAKAILEYETGEVTVKTVCGKNIALSLGVKNNSLLVTDKDFALKSHTVKTAWEFEQSREWLSKYAFEAPEILSEEDTKGWAQPCPDDPSMACLCLKKNDHFVISLEPGKDNKEAFTNAKKVAEKIRPEDFTEVNSAWWKNYWHDLPELNFPGEFFNKFYKYALYKFAGATSPESSVPSGLQGPWIEEYHKAQWSGDYHFNVNIQQIYTLAFATGKVDHLMPLFNMIESDVFMKNIRHNAKAMFGIDDGILLTHAVDDRGFQCGGISAGSTLDQACGAWTAQLYWLYYKYTGDREFLRNRAYPFMYGVMRVYEEMLEEHEGRLSIPLSISAEYGCRNPNGIKAGRDPSYQLSCIHMLLDALNESCAVLDMEPRGIWQEMKERIPHFNVIEIDTPLEKQKRIAIWEGQDLDVCHRHHSHLGCIFPFNSLPEEKSAEMEEILDNSIDHWILMGMGQWSEWCIPWAASIQIRLGFNEAPSVLFDMWEKIFINEGLNTVYLPAFRGIIAHRKDDLKKPKETNEVMQLDGTMGCAAALLDMCAHEYRGTVQVFAGIPSRWSDMSFKDINLPGGVKVSGVKRNGNIEKVSIYSTNGGKLKLDIPWRKKLVLKQDKTASEISLPAEIRLARHETVELYSAE